MKVAVEGCAHGELDKIYETISELEKQYQFKVDLLIICGDFQAVRNASDMDCMAVPKKYQEMKDFHKYYSGQKKAPLLTIVIGGNHEASNFLAELAYGGWLCENIYFMGYAGVVKVNGIRIAGISGIYKGHDYLKGHFEVPPYNDSTKRSAYHLRSLEIFRLKQLAEPVDIVISHDWPRGIYNYGNTEKLLQQKKFFVTEVRNNTLGCRPTESLLEQLKPKYWFAAHLHCKFAAQVDHQDGTCTKFLALDKCLPRRDFLQTLDIPSSSEGPPRLSYDLEWLCVLQLTDHLLHLDSKNHYMPGPGCNERWQFTPTQEEKDKLADTLKGDLLVPCNFQRTAPVYVPGSERSPGRARPHINPQTRSFCQRFGLRDPLAEALCPQHDSTKLDISSFLGTDDVTSSTLPSCSESESQSQSQNQSESQRSTDLGVDEDPLHEMSAEERQRVHTQEFGGPDSSTGDKELFPALLEKKEEEAKPRASSGRAMKRRNQSLYTDSEDVDN
ncbi:lariat debranching enzyme isoform X1 [Haemaphysalis longicornis]